MAEGIFSGW
jgi:hypothetical protein